MLHHLHSSARWLANGLQLDEWTRGHPLQYLFLEVTRRCNLRCAYCGSECTAESVRRELSADQWIAVVDEIAEDFDAASVMVAVTGGEPLLKPGIFDILEALDRRRFPFGMVTNATLLDRDAARRLASTRMANIAFSLDGPPAVNDALRGEGCFEATAAAIGHLREAGYRGKMEVISVLTAPAAGHLAAMRQELARLRIAHWRVAPVIPIGRAAEAPDMIPDAEALRTILDFVRAAREDGLKPRPAFGEEGYLGDGYEGHVRDYLYRCHAGLTTAGIMYDGAIGACPELPDSFDQGHVHSDRFADVWNDRYQVFRDRSWTRDGACGECEVFDRCRGGSLHLYSGPGEGFCRCFHEMLAL